MIEGVAVKPIHVIADERGRVIEVLRSDDPLFERFGQVFVSTAYPGVVKAWHYHRKQWDHFVVVAGMMKVVLYDARDDSPTHGDVEEYFLGEHNPILVQIPPLVYHGFKCISEREAIVINCPTEVYDYAKPDEYRVDPHASDIPYDWARKDG